MNSNVNPTPRQNHTNASVSFTNETILQQEKKEGLTTKLRQTVNAIGKRGAGGRNRQIPLPDLTSLTPQSQELILQTVEKIKNEDSEQVIVTLDESRDILRSLYEEFQNEQSEYKKKLEQITRNKEAAIRRRRENAVPISLFLRQKKDTEGSADLRPNSSMNETYQAHFQALLTTNQNPDQHPTDKAAVIKYIRRRERRKRAEQNRKSYEVTDETLEKQTVDLMDELDSMDMKFERERQRQNEISRTKMQQQRIKSHNVLEAKGIIDQAHEANLIRQRAEQAQREKIEARLSAVRRRTPSAQAHSIHVQSPANDRETDSQLTNEQRAATQNSIRILNDNDAFKDLDDELTKINI
ncbi:unnamed protein product [Adineta steineri]|uniref:Uncharacterized protein n=1 Tax=Adineta steineri TaxID=433720 RepID=A0A813WMT2_9BILA|nr:unnamed protein product [Adineta steineri]CAF0823116.1 unnamed protein product [Adineta steineri]CAF0863663.1 unnamed protein product [Adineta steineri]